MRFLLKPGWIALTLGVALFATACFTTLAPWQFGRHHDRDSQNSAIETSFHQPPVPLARLLPDGRSPAPTDEWRQVHVTGHFLPATETLIRLRTVKGDPALEVVTALRTQDGHAVLVDRGYVRPTDGPGIPSYPAAPPGEVTLTGRVRLAEHDDRGRGVTNSGGRRQAFAVDPDVLGRATGLPLPGFYVQLAAGQPGGLGTLGVPDIDSGPFLSYAWQWLAFGVMAILGWVYFVRLEIIQRRGGRPGRSQDRERPTAARTRRGDRSAFRGSPATNPAGGPPQPTGRPPDTVGARHHGDQR